MCIIIIYSNSELREMVDCKITKGVKHMLQKFKVRNYKNFRDELIFSFITSKNYEFNKELVKDGIIKDSLVIGENASGKTNLGVAIFDIICHLTDKGRKEIKLYSNLYNPDLPVEFDYTFRFGDSVLRYCYEKKDADSIMREQIFVNDKKILENSPAETKVLLKGTENLDLEKWDSSISLVKYVYANSVLDKKDETCTVFYQFMQYVNNMLWFSSTEGNRYMGFSNEKGNLFETVANTEGAIEKLQSFLQEMGICYQLLVKDDGESKNIYTRMGKKVVPLASLISSGTRSLIFFFLWYMQIEKCSFLYVDEFDAFYHTDLAKAVIRKIIEIPNVQAVITSHNTDLMTNDLLRPDCIFKLEDNRIKPFSELTDKSLREAHNLQKMYKAGAFND